MSTLKAWVHTLKYEAQDIISVELRPMPGETLPAFEAGAHIDLHLPSGLVRSYSLANDSRERHRYLLGILKDKASRGGSINTRQVLDLAAVNGQSTCCRSGCCHLHKARLLDNYQQRLLHHLSEHQVIRLVDKQHWPKAWANDML